MEHSVSSLDYDELVTANDVVISGYLKMMIEKEKTWPDYFVQDVDVFNKNPREVFKSKNPIFAFVKTRTETCGKTEGCESGCWRIIGRDKLIKSKATWKILGFKKILKFCEKTKPREYKRSWVMEEYRIANKWKQDQVICKITLMFEAEISFLLAKHFSYLYYYTSSVPFSKKELCADYGISTPEEDVSYMQKIIESEGNYWPSYFIRTNNVYNVEPWTLVGLENDDESFSGKEMCFYVNRTETYGKTDGCDGGCWRTIKRDKLIKSETGKILGIKRTFQFFEKEKRKYAFKHEDEEEELMITWTMEEYRLAKKMKQDKLLCVIKLWET